jgi:ssDNA-binding Zn-finger/Zn-ribbon topoisomerase 1
MAEKKAKTAEKNPGEVQHKHLCPQCGADSKVTLFTGFGRKGFFLVCEKACGYMGRIR